MVLSKPLNTSIVQAWFDVRLSDPFWWEIS
jgi:hypothetical protein